MNRIKQQEDCSFIQQIIEKKTLFKSKLAYALYSDHEHYFSKSDVWFFMKKKSSKPIVEPRCKVCALRLTQYHAEVRYQTMEIPAFKYGE